MLITIQGAGIRKPIDVIDYVTGSVIPTRKTVELILRPITVKDVDRETMEEWEKSLYGAYDQVPDEAKPLFEQIVRHLHEKRVSNMKTLFTGAALAAVILVTIGIIKG